MELRPLLSHRRYASRRSLTSPPPSRAIGPAALRHLLARIVEPPDAPPPPPDPTPQAGVLVPVVLTGAPFILLTRRSPLLRHHADQVSFPGGRIDPGDAGPEAAALREAHEEIALDPAAATILGRLPAIRTSTGFHITPILACIHPDAVWRAAPAEVAEILMLPVSNLFDPTACRREGRHWVWHHPDHHIWGATAAILATLAERLKREASAGLCPEPRQGQSPLEPPAEADRAASD